jgi:hypothetical protein
MWKKKKRCFHLCHHTEKLAIAFGLINPAPGTPLQIIKNLQVCKDLPHFHKVDFKGEQSWRGMPITFITLRMVFVRAWTIGDASSLSSQLLHQVHFVYSMSRGIMTPP